MWEFIKNFRENKGAWVSLSLLISKISLFLLTILVAKTLPKEEFGLATQAINFLGFFIPFTGLGSYQGLLRFGSIFEGEDRERLFRYSLFYGFLGQIGITILMYIIAFLLFKEENNLLLLIFALGIRFFGLFLLELQKIKFRNEFLNEKFAILEGLHAIFSLIFGVIFCYFFGFLGYIFSLCISPFIVLPFFSPFRGDFKWNFQQFSVKEFWKFSITAGITSQISGWIFMLDILFIGLMLNDKAVADYRISAIIPMNLFILSNIFTQTDYPKLCKYHLDKKYIFDYIKNYLIMMGLASIFILIIGYFSAPYLLQIFGKEYHNTYIFRVLLISAVAGITLRSLFGILIAAIGKVQWNLYISIISVVFLSVNLYITIPHYGIEGAAWACAINMILIGIANCIFFFKEYKKLTNTTNH